MLIELKANDFSAIVPQLKELPVMRVLAIELTEDPAYKMGMLVNLLRDSISPELHEAFDKLNSIAMQEILLQWIEQSME